MVKPLRDGSAFYATVNRVFIRAGRIRLPRDQQAPVPLARTGGGP